PPPPRPPLFPYTTLFRSEVRRVEAVDLADLRAHDLSGVDAVLYGPSDRGLRQSGPSCRIVDSHRSVAEDITSHPFAQPRLGVERSEEHTSELQSRFDLVC